MLARLRPHVSGILYIALVLLVGLAAVNNQNNMLFWVFGVLVAGLVLSVTVSRMAVRSLQVRRIDPQHGAVGEPLIVRYAVTNRSRLLSAFSIHVEELPPAGEARGLDQQQRDWRRIMKPASAWIMHVGPRETVHGEAVFWPIARGEVRLNRLQLSTSFPFGMFRRCRVMVQPQHTLIHPMLYELNREVIKALALPGLLGSRVSQHAGAGDDYFGLREFRPGDSLRHIAWKRTARLDQLVCIDRTAPSPARVRVILDLTTATNLLRVGEHDKLTPRELEERAISLAGSLIHQAEAEGFEVGLTVMGFDVPEIAVRRSPWHVGKMMAALAAVELDLPRLAPRPHVLREAERAALVVISPDRMNTLAERSDALHLTARQLDNLAVRPIGWDPSSRLASAPAQRPAARPARTIVEHAA
jgi:uncharacterized protein (DUF58 family)